MVAVYKQKKKSQFSNDEKSEIREEGIYTFGGKDSEG